MKKTLRGFKSALRSDRLKTFLTLARRSSESSRDGHQPLLLSTDLQANTTHEIKLSPKIDRIGSFEKLLKSGRTIKLLANPDRQLKTPSIISFDGSINQDHESKDPSSTESSRNPIRSRTNHDVKLHIYNSIDPDNEIEVI